MNILKTITIAICALLAPAIAAQAADKGEVTVTKPTKSATDTVTVKLKAGSQNATLSGTFGVLKADTPQTKATLLRNAIHGKTATMHIDGVQRTVRLVASTNGTTVTVSAVYNIDDAVDVSEVVFKNKSKQKKDKVRIISALAKTASLELFGNAATGVDESGAASVVEVGTARGVASVSPAAGTSLTAIRDTLVGDLVAIGVDAVASGVAGIVIDMTSADGDAVEFGSTDQNVSMEGRIGTE